MRALTRRITQDGYTQEVEIREHELRADEPVDAGGNDDGPTPQELLAASLASCTAITVEMYARRKGWEVGLAEVECRYDQAERGNPTQFEIVLRLPASLTDEQRERLRVIAGRCPVHRTLEGGVRFTDWVGTLQSTTRTPARRSSSSARSTSPGRASMPRLARVWSATSKPRTAASSAVARTQ